jgi:YD repeat-containing protein
VTQATTTTLNTSKLLKYTYDGNDNLKTIRYPSGKTVTYLYNSKNQVKNIYGFGSTVSGITYLTTGRKRGLLHSYKFGNGDPTIFSYNNRRTMTETKNPRVSWLQFIYDDKRGNMTSLIDKLNGWKNRAFDYDNRNRLITFNNSQPPHGWGYGQFDYDAGGNRTLKKRTGTSDINYNYFSGNRLTRAGATYYSYNQAGDMTRAGGFSQTTGLSFEYTPFHRLQLVKENNQVKAEYGYDANDNRIFKKAGVLTEIYLRGPDGNTYADLFPSGRSKSEYLFMNGKIIARFGKKIIPDVEPTDTGSLPWLMLLLDNEDN